jgi:glyoxylase-like metal-dependent hydrolase (beta-lactamase superfamily II)
MKVGDAEIIALSDMNCAYPTAMGELWPNVPVDDWKQYKERYPDTFDGDKMRLEIGCYLVRSQGRTILIDTGYGPGPIDYIGGLRGELMADLARQKIEPTEVDTVFLSHLHLDHVGWNTIDQGGKFVPTFPNARYIAHQADLDHFRKPEVRDASRYPYLDRCVEPLVELGIFDTITQDSDLTSEVRAIHTPGHTPGHMSVMVASSGQRALIQGDVLIHPAQVTESGWSPLFDGDFELATDTRRKLLDQVETDGTTVVSCHFPAPGFGKVVRQEGKRYWQVGV